MGYRKKVFHENREIRTLSLIHIFYRQNLQGKELANWKFQRYMRDYMKTVKSLDDNVGRVLDLSLIHI